MGQKFRARNSFKYINGAIGWAPGGPMDCIGPYAKVQNCPIDGTSLRLTCYATGYADTMFSVPACTRYKGKHVGGFFMNEEDGPIFCPLDKYKDRLPCNLFKVIERFNGFELVHVPTGKTAWLGDGVDVLSISPGTPEFVTRWQEDLNEESGQTLECYFPELCNYPQHFEAKF